MFVFELSMSIRMMGVCMAESFDLVSLVHNNNPTDNNLEKECNLGNIHVLANRE